MPKCLMDKCKLVSDLRAELTEARERIEMLEKGLLIIAEAKNKTEKTPLGRVISRVSLESVQRYAQQVLDLAKEAQHEQPND